MLQLLLDEHISPVVARSVQAKRRGVEIVAFQRWRDGSFMGADDRVFLPAAKMDGLTLVSYDQKTIRPLLKDWAEQGIDHGGLVFVDTKTIAPQDFGDWNALPAVDFRKPLPHRRDELDLLRDFVQGDVFRQLLQEIGDNFFRAHGKTVPT